ncbi:MAG: NAD(P)/FAD-dependent oxidoreductase [Gemmatales bacterium]
MTRCRIAIVGAGPAGLTAALTAQHYGLHVRIFEQATDFCRVGGGLMMHRNGLRVLESLDLLDSIRPNMRFTQLFELWDSCGRRIAQSNLAELPGPHNQAAVVLRYHLQEYLSQAARNSGIEVEFGRRLTGVTIDGHMANLQFVDGRDETADIVIAADGIHSALRRVLWPDVKERVVGEAYLRLVTPVRTESSVIREIWSRDGRRFGICPLPDQATYVFCTVPLGQWSDIRDRGLHKWIDSWRDFGPEAEALLCAVRDWSGVNYSELREVELDHWHRPPVFLVGDAAHAMTPNLGQGANSAMVDAFMLMTLLAESSGRPLPEVAAKHERIRLEAVTRTQRQARMIGRSAQLRSWPARSVRDWAITLQNAIPMMRRSFLKTMAGVDPEVEPYYMHSKFAETPGAISPV